MDQSPTSDRATRRSRQRTPSDSPDILEALKPANGRWTPACKARIVMALALGQVGRAAVLQGLDLSEEELADWERRFDAAGSHGLRLPRSRDYRA